MNSLRIAIDGGAATGKSTVAKLVAKKLGIRYINTGQIYRFFALVAMENNIINDEEAIFNLIQDYAITYTKDGLITSPNFHFDKIKLESKEVGANASVVAAMPKVREIATEKLIQISRESGVLLEGRDIGTVVMPDADFKFFVEVDPEVAAERRVKQHISNGEQVEFENVLKDIIERNERDKTREVAPLIPTDTSIIINTSHNTAEEIAQKIFDEVTHG